jgi:urease accessory protein
MQLAEPVSAAGWRAELALGYERRGARTVLAQRRHDGPLVVQKPLYPEGDAVCHTIVVHPPGGIAGGDDLELSATIGEKASALLTTPGAAKWYRSAGPWARQTLSFEVDGVLEWLPQETILFDGAVARISTEVRLARDARFLGWEIVCLGRTGSGERFTRGSCDVATKVHREDRLVWLERGRIEGGGALLGSPAGLAGGPVYGTLCASFPEISSHHAKACREANPAQGDHAVTLLPGILIARYLGDSSESARRYFTALWKILRPALCAREAVEPRIWRT